eukprot:7644216-Alexandrium_andersonii.AAC.1
MPPRLCHGEACDSGANFEIVSGPRSSRFERLKAIFKCCNDRLKPALLGSIGSIRYSVRSAISDLR